MTKTNTKTQKTVNIAVSNNNCGAMVGDVLCSTWGYDQTNYDFYKVIKTTAKTVTLEKMSGHDKGAILKSRRTQSNSDSEYYAKIGFHYAWFRIDDQDGEKQMAEAREEYNPYTGH